MARRGRAAAPAEGFVIDGTSTTDMRAPQLRVLAHRLHEELAREKEDRNLMQLERDKLHTFLEICRQQLAECQAGLRAKQHENEDAEEKHQVALKHVEQRVKYLMHEHERLRNEAVADGRVTLQSSEGEFTQQYLMHSEDMQNLKQQLTEANITCLKQIQSLKLQCRREKSEALANFLDEKNKLQKKADKQLTEMREELALKYRMDQTELEIRKNTQITELVKQHESAFSNMKYYFNDIMDNNLSLIKNLKEHQKELQRKLDEATAREREHRRVRMLTSAADRSQQAPPSAKATVRPPQPAPARAKSVCDGGRSASAETRTQLSNCKKAYDNLMCENEILQFRIKKLEDAQARLVMQHREATQELLEEAGLQAVLRDSRVSRLKEMLEREKARVARALVSADFDPDLRDLVHEHIDRLLATNNNHIQELLYELARVCKAHDDLLRTYEAKLRKYGVPPEGLGFEPLRVDMKNLRLGRGPAALVTRNR